MNNLQLEERLVGYPVRVVCADSLPLKIYDRPQTFIVNTDICRGRGQHWVVFHFPERGPCEFFDSLGNPPMTYHRRFERVLIVNGPRYFYTPSQIQPNVSKTCGLYCIYFVQQRYQRKSFKTIVRQFSVDRLWENDKKIIDKTIRGDRDTDTPYEKDGKRR